MFKIVEWNPDLDLSEFYNIAKEKGFENNSSQAKMVDCFRNEREKQVWILYFNDRAVGSVAAHSFDDVMGPNTYRIAARTCVFTDKLEGPYSDGLRTISVITKHQNPTAQFLIPKCIEWAPAGSRLFITSNQSTVGTQRGVHNVFGPALERKGIMRSVKEVEYRGTVQTVWELFPDKFLDDLYRYPRWN